MAITDRFKKAWNAFRQEERKPPGDAFNYNLGPPIYSPIEPMRRRFPYQGERTIISSIYTRMSIDVAEIPMKHVKVDESERYLEDVDSALNDALLFEANLDQTPFELRQNIAKTLFNDGVAAIVPVDTTLNPNTNEIFDIYTLRVGNIVSWYPEHVKVDLYNEKLGKRQEVLLEKRYVAIVTNPFYDVMNEYNSTLQRLTRKLSLLDVADENTAAGKLDIIIQLPYTVKSEARKTQAEARTKAIEMQLTSSQYGIAYADATEKITQLNRPVENQLLSKVEYLTKTLYDQLGITQEIMAGTADEKTMLNYQNRTIVPIVNAITTAMQRAFIGHEGYKKQERIMYFHNPFKFVPLADIAEISDKFTRNEIATSNEIRGIIGFVPSDDPKADKLQNSNMPQNEDGGESAPEKSGNSSGAVEEMDRLMNEILDGIESDVDKFGGGSG